MKRLTIHEALKLLQSQQAPYVEMFRHGSLQVEFYQPIDVDKQQPHRQDELYVIASGSGDFINGNSRQPVERGEVLFVPAGQEHRFVDFDESFATWVIFFGPEGGESPHSRY